MKRIIFTVALVALTLSQAVAQYTLSQNKRWMFGGNAGVDFTSGTPTATSSSMSATEGTVTVSDASGNLLFYSEGTKVWDRTGAVMPSGGSLVSYSTASATQGCLAVPVSGSTTQYYLFSLEGVPGGTSYCKLAYCIVDMSMAGGFGDVVAATLATPVTDLLSEKMTAVPGNNCDVWMLVHRKDSAKFLAYNISASGISAPVVSTVGTFTTAGSYGGYSIGAVKATHDRRRLVTANWNSGGDYGAELYDFDATTGIVSNCVVINTSSVQYGAEFSPDNTKLYLQTQSNITQYDLTAGSTAAIIASAYAVGTSVYWSALRLGPDGKIYFGGPSGSALGAITSPNTGGSGCGYTASAVTLASGTSFTLGLPNINVLVGGGDTTFVRRDTSECIPAGGSITLTAPTTTATTTTYFWDDGSTSPTRAITGVGTYWVVVDTTGCHREIDTFVVTSPPLTTTTRARDTSLCGSAATFTLTAPAGYTTYLWNTGATTATLSASASGNYYVTCSIGCTALVDTIHVNVIPYLSFNTTRDTSFCFPGTVTLHAQPGFSSYLWQDGTVGAQFNATTQGTYWVVYYGSCDVRTDTVHIIPAPLTVDLGPDVSVCMNYLIVPSISDKNATYLWQDGTVESTYSASRSGTYRVTVKLGGCVATDEVKVNFIHLSQNIPDTFICKGTPIELNVNATVPAGGSIVWENGSTNPSRIIRDSGTYWVYVKQNECQILDTVRVVTGHCDCWYDVPTAFTPNADGLNDIIRPKVQPGCTISGYQFSVYNRWGELMYTSLTPGSGWDGTYKGVPADMGVYFYSLNLFVGIHDKATKHHGSFTLIR